MIRLADGDFDDADNEAIVTAAANAALCSGYVSGVVTANWVTREFVKRWRGKGMECSVSANGERVVWPVDDFEEELLVGYCPPEDVEPEQLVRIVHKYLKEHPKDLDMLGVFLINMSLSDAFPCPEDADE